jgi:hypothetical protein
MHNHPPLPYVREGFHFDDETPGFAAISTCDPVCVGNRWHVTNGHIEPDRAQPRLCPSLATAQEEKIIVHVLCGKDPPKR